MNEGGEQAAFIKITELIGEMAWGIGLPSPMMVVVMQELMGKPEEVHAVHPDNYKVVFEAIWQKLKSAPEYQPYEKLKADLNKLREDFRGRMLDEDAIKARLESEVDGLFARCKIVFYPAEGQYPIEHSMAANKDSRSLIEQALKESAN